ncbi:hypothetical protein ABLE93_09920 [Xanthobacter sp. KR7-65]|uniref:hypothetical protein n=1 Tax=Xanthobacter sp. KR7-65 TaxID=3156612 RepID=UPI0032B3E951
MERAQIPSFPSPAARPLTVSMSVLISAVMVVSMTTLGALLLGQGWTAARQALIKDAHDTTLAIGEHIDQRFQRHLTPGSVSLLLLARGPLMTAATLDERLQHLPLLTEILTRLPGTAAIHVGYADGDFFLVRPLRTPGTATLFDAPPGAAYMVQSITREAGAPGKEELVFFDANLHLLATRETPPTGYDPRTRNWYRGAMERRGPFLTRPYVFFTTRELGLTQSIPSPSGGAVLGLEQNLADLATTLRDLRTTPGTEIAVVGTDGNVYGYYDLARIYRRTNEEVQFTSVAELGVPGLSALVAKGAPAGQAVNFEAGGESWFGITVPLTSFSGRELNLLVAIPESDLLSTARAALARQVWGALAVMAVLLAIGWLIGRRLGGALTQLTRHGEALTRFDFRVPSAARSHIREIQRLEEVLGQVCITIQNFLTTAETIGSEPGLDRMLAKVLGQTVAATGCTAGAVYLLDAKGEGLVLSALADKAGGQTAVPATEGDAFPAGLPLTPSRRSLMPTVGRSPTPAASPCRCATARARCWVCCCWITRPMPRTAARTSASSWRSSPARSPHRWRRDSCSKRRNSCSTASCC